MLSRWANVNVRTAGIASLEQREAGGDSFCGHAVETRKHPSIAQHSNIVERCFNRGKHVANCDFSSIHFVTFKMLLPRGEVQGGNNRAARLAWANERTG